MNRILMLFFSFVVFMLISACEHSSNEIKKDTNRSEEQDLEVFLKTVKLPEHFSITFDETNVSSVDEAKIYTASPLEFEEDKVQEKLLRKEIVENHVYAEGPQVVTDDKNKKEYLTVYDGGKSFDTDSGIYGGITYSIHVDEESLGSKLLLVASDAAGPPANKSTQKYGYNLKSDFDSNMDLSFMNYEEALTKVEETLSTIGFPELVVSETYSVDLNTMLDHYDLYLEASTDNSADPEKEHDTYDWSEQDEHYLFIFQQVIDEIPLANIPWQKEDVPTGEIPATTIDIRYSKDGVVDLEARHLLDIKESEDEKQLISGVSALEKVIDAYSDVLLEDDIRVTSMELNYVARLTNDNNYRLVPAWIFGVAQSKEWADEDEENGTYVDYSYYVIDATTGKRIEEARDDK